MEKKKYIRPAIKVYNITPSVILAGSSLEKASDVDYGRLTGSEYYGDWHHPDNGGLDQGDPTRGNPNAGYRTDASRCRVLPRVRPPAANARGEITFNCHIKEEATQLPLLFVRLRFSSRGGHGDRYVGSLFRVDEPVPDDSLCKIIDKKSFRQIF